MPVKWDVNEAAPFITHIAVRGTMKEKKVSFDTFSLEIAVLFLWLPGGLSQTAVMLSFHLPHAKAARLHPE